MDKYRSTTSAAEIGGITDYVSDVAIKVGAAGIGFGIGGGLGYIFENKFAAGVTPKSHGGDKLWALLANNLPKLALLTGMRTKEPTGTDIADEVWRDAEVGVAGSIGIDLILRGLNGFAPPDITTGKKILSPEDYQKLVQENSAAKAELSKAIQELTAKRSELAQLQQQVGINPPKTLPPPVTPPRGPMYRPTPPGAPMTAPPTPVIPTPTIEETYTPPAVQERQRRFGAMQYTPPHVQERQKRYGFMSGEEKDIAQVFGML